MMSSRIHTKRPKHKKMMILAQADIKTSQFHVEEANFYRGVHSVDYHDAAKRHAISGWEYVNHAIEHVVECGCPSSLWPEEVRDAIPD